MKKNLSFQFLWIGQSLANLGDALFMLSIISFIYKVTHSVTFTALFTVLQVGGQSISGVLAPLVMDRYRLSLILMTSQVGQTILLMILTIFLIPISSATFFMPLVLLVVFSISFLDGWTNPSRNALVPRLVQPNQLIQANSLLATSDQVVRLLGWSLGGVLIAYIGEEKLLWIIIGMMTVSTASLFLLKEPKGAMDSRDKSKSKLDHMKEGWVALWRDPILRSVSLMEMFEICGRSIWAGAIVLVFVKDVLQKGEAWWGFINASYFAGTIIGGLVIWFVAKWVYQHIYHSMFLGSTGVCIFTLWFAFNTNPWIALLLTVFMGPAYQLRGIAQKTLFQNRISSHLLPKAFSAQNTIINVAFGLSILIMGFISDVWGVKTVYFVTASLFALSALLAVILKKKYGGPFDVFKEST